MFPISKVNISINKENPHLLMKFNVFHVTLGMIEGTLPETKLDCLATCLVTEVSRPCLTFQILWKFQCKQSFCIVTAFYIMWTASKNMSLLVAKASLIILLYPSDLYLRSVIKSDIILKHFTGFGDKFVI